MLRYLALAVDFDGTIARDGYVEPTTIDALRRVRQQGRYVILVTGRRLDDLRDHLPQVELFDRIVAEDGAVVYCPATREERLLAEPPPPELVAAMQARGVEPIDTGRVIIATWQPHEMSALAAIRELGLEHHVVFNKGAVMVLPPGVNKASGLSAALAELRLSSHNVVVVGDAENDQAMLSLAECAVAVANALPALKAHADYVTAGDHGAGVVEIIEQLLADDLASLAPRLRRHEVLLGRAPTGEVVTISPYGTNVLVAGPSGCGKSTLATGLLERFADHGYQFCLVDPEGDYEDFANAIVIGDAQRPPLTGEVLRLLGNPDQSVVVNLLGVPNADRPAHFAGLLTELEALRARVGRPHWIAADEAHYQLPAGWSPAVLSLPPVWNGAILVSVHPDHIARTALEQMDVVIAVGQEADQTLDAFARAVEVPAPDILALPEEGCETVVWRRPSAQAVGVRPVPPRAAHRRHQRKYARGEITPWNSFYFRGPQGHLNLRAQNLAIFVQIAEGIDDVTWLYHLHRGDYAQWFRDIIKDEELAHDAERVARNSYLSASESRAQIQSAIESRYTLPA
jgi:hydroxymethylpyrimidine pyrophosphatase-like HAD family hydrolase/energy-coupling factor transporter ATP-binding protein EcfA2